MLIITQNKVVRRQDLEQVELNLQELRVPDLNSSNSSIFLGSEMLSVNINLAVVNNIATTILLVQLSICWNQHSIFLKRQDEEVSAFAF